MSIEEAARPVPCLMQRAGSSTEPPRPNGLGTSPRRDGAVIVRVENRLKLGDHPVRSTVRCKYDLYLKMVALIN